MSAKVIPAILLALVMRPQLDERGRAVVKDDKPVLRKVKSTEVFAFNIRGDQVVVVTDDGQKYSATIPADVKAQVDKAEQKEKEPKQEPPK